MASHSQDAYGRRPSVTTNPPVNRTRRAWTDQNGNHVVLETSSYSSPEFSFAATNGTVGSPLQGSTSQHTGPGLLGTAFGLLGDALAAKQQRAGVREQSRRASDQAFMEDLAYGEDGFEDGHPAASRRPQSFVSKVADRLLNTNLRKMEQARGPSSRRQDSGRSKMDSKSRTYRTEERRPSWADGRSVSSDSEASEDNEDDDDNSEDEVQYRPESRRRKTANRAALINALENAAEHHRNEAKKCRKRLEQASRQSRTNTVVLQNLLNELKRHENAYEDALRNLSVARANNANDNRQRETPRRTQGTQSVRPSMARNAGHARTSPQAGSQPFFSSPHVASPRFGDFGDFHAFNAFSGTPFGAFNHMFNDIHNTGPRSPLEGFFAMPGFTFTTNQQRPQARFTFTNRGSQWQHNPGPASFVPPPQASPANLMRPEEARRLFQAYDARWKAITQTDANIPYPGRGLQAAALTARDTIWAQLVRSPVSTWSEEHVMQANAQAFFLGVVGLTPQYTETPGTGRIVMGYDKAQATPAQVKALVDILKKEKIRWHSDRLGRRNGGTTGPNESLQRDEKARAVFHAVCELMEAAQ